MPFILTAGKALQEKKVEVRIVFREAPCQVPELRGACRNELVVRVQPDERVYWRVANKVPGLEELQVEPRRMNLMYTHTEVQGMPDAYERLVLEVLRGDATNFVSVDELDASWAVFSPALLALEGTQRTLCPWTSSTRPGPCSVRPCWRWKVRSRSGTPMVARGRRSSGSTGLRKLIEW